jgi:hypothetical protein
VTWPRAHAYAADMNLAQQALLADDLGKGTTPARPLLAWHRTGASARLRVAPLGRRGAQRDRDNGHFIH